jgi:hypothetical protein
MPEHIQLRRLLPLLWIHRRCYLSSVPPRPQFSEEKIGRCVLRRDPALEDDAAPIADLKLHR